MTQDEGPVKGSCHCGAVTLRVPHAPEWGGSCNWPHQSITLMGTQR